MLVAETGGYSVNLIAMLTNAMLYICALNSKS